MRNKLKKNKAVVSLFSGCGGMDFGFEGDFDVPQPSINKTRCDSWITGDSKEGWVHLKPTSFRIVFANDIDDRAAVAWCTYFKEKNKFDNSIWHAGSILDHVERAKTCSNYFHDDDVDVVIGGFPCQDFSVNGRRLGLSSDKSHRGDQLSKYDDPEMHNRGKLYKWMLEVIEILQPKIFIAENVKGLIYLKNIMKVLKNDFEEISENGYFIYSAVLNAAEYGIPQTRERIFFIGVKKSALKNDVYKLFEKNIIPNDLYPFPAPTHYIDNDANPTTTPYLLPAVTARQAFFRLKEPEDETSDLAQRYYSKASRLSRSQGQNEIKLDAPGHTIRANHNGNIEFRRILNGDYRDEIAEGKRERRLTVRECARIQSFPDDFEFVIRDNLRQNAFILSPTAAYILIGNAVPPLMGYNIAQRLEKIWDLIFA